jgi:integrase
MTPENVTPTHATDVAPLLPAGLTPDDVAGILEDAANARSESTRRVYDSAWRQFARFCDERGAVALPAAPEIVAAWVRQRPSVASVDLALAAIRARHEDVGLTSPTLDVGVVKVREGVRRRLGVATEKAHALTVPQLRRILAGIDDTELRGARDTALLLLAFATGMRRSELAALTVGDVRYVGDKLLIRIRKGKGDQEGRGRTLPAVAHGAHAATDPVRAVLVWLERAGITSDTDGPLFRRIRVGDRLTTDALSGRAISDVLQARAAAVGLEALDLSGHSTRRGHAVAAHEGGVPTENIQAQLGHRSEDTTRGYLEESQALRASYTPNLGL